MDVGRGCGRHRHPSGTRNLKTGADGIEHQPRRAISVALIDDNRLVRDGIMALLNQAPDLKVVAGSGRPDMSFLKGVRPAVFLLDLGLRDADSLAVARQIKQDFPDSKIIVMDLIPVHEDIVELIHVGVAGFIMKDATLEELVKTIRSVAEGAHVLPPQMTGTLFSHIARHALGKDEAAALEDTRMTPREREVINLIAEGLGNKQIAMRLHIATHTVKSHVRNIMEKLTLHSRLQIASYAHRQGPL